jgi:hypothetical protein
MPTNWTEQDQTALLALLTRFVRAFDARAKLGAQKAELDKQIVVEDLAVKKLTAAFDIFGLDTKIEGWSLPIRDAVGQEPYNAALLAGGRSPQSHYPKASNGTLPLTAKVENLDGSVREMVLQLLNEAGAKGTTASTVREAIEKSRGAELHYKTVGMTLYRLSQEKLARREGRTWFAVPETANPGVAAPGFSRPQT